jgi:hypothetical protein
MNSATDNRELNWIAIGAGAAVTVSLGLIMLVISHLVVPELNSSAYQWIRYGGIVLSFIGDLGGGGLAGWLGAPRGALHASISNVLATVVGWITGIAVNVLRFGPELPYLKSPEYWAWMLLWGAVGIATATFAGFVAAKVRAHSGA